MFKYGLDHLTSSKALAILNQKLQAVLTPETRQAVVANHTEVVEIANGSKAVYGINTGFGPLCNTKIPKEETAELQRNLLISHSVGVGEPIAKNISKLMLILKVHSLCKAHSGISPQIIERLIWHVENDIIPVVPSQGSVGASGDLAPLSHLFLPLLGEGEVFINGVIKPTSEVFQNLNIKPITLHPKAGLALINGTQFILAHAVFLVDRLFSCIEHANTIAAIMIEGLQASLMPFHPALHNTRPYPANQYVANHIYQLLQGSKIMQAHENCERVQDPYSLRCVPQVHGSSLNAWQHLKKAVEIELNSVTDNPIIFSKDFTVSGGNFHGQPLALPIDYACLAASELGNISDRRTYLALDGKYDIPKLLMENTGVKSGLMICQYASAALASENKTLCFPASADSIPTSMGQEDHVSMGSIGARKALKVVENLERILAIELLCAAQALDFRRPLESTHVIEEIHKTVRSRAPFATQDRIFSKDINALTQLIKERKLIEIVAKHFRNNSIENQKFESF